MSGRIATITGTMLAPGVSRNRRLYTADLISRAAARMSEQIADPDGLPIVMRTHHEAGDDSVRIVGRLTAVKLAEDGSAKYSADLYDTAHGRDIANLVVPDKDQPPALRSVSIHGYWLGPVRSVTYEGESVTTGDDLEIDAVDFTGTPGVLGATVDAATWIRPGDTAESTGGRTRISESVEATVQAITETDPGPAIRTKADVRRAVREGSRGTDQQRAHVIVRAAALGHHALIPGTWKADGSMESTTRYSDIREYYDGPGGAAGFCIDAYNGPTSLTIRNCSIDPADLRVIAAAAMDAAINALQAVDPDMDGDVDIPGAPAEDTDGDMGAGESVTPVTPAAASTAPHPLAQTSRANQAGDRNHQEEAVMAETTETAAPARSLTDADISALGALFGGALKEAMAPVTAALAETRNQAAAPVAAESLAAAPAVAETAPAAAPKDKGAKRAKLAESLAEIRASFDTRLTEALAKQRDELRESMLREYGTPARQGYRVHENDKAPDTAEDLFADRASILLGAIGIGGAPAQ